MTLRVYQPDFDWFRRNRLLIAVSLLCVVFGAAIVVGSAVWARDQAQNAVRERSVSTLNLVIENLRGELSKFIYMPKVLSSLESLAPALATPSDPAAVRLLADELDQIANISGAKAIHLVDRNGHAVATSGADPMAATHAFAEEPYFRDALQGRLGRYFSVGARSRERSYFFAHPVRTGKTIAGVIVIQLELDNLEPLWFSANSEILVVDENGIVFLSSRPEWRSRSLSPLSEDTRTRLADRYQQQTFAPLPFVDGLQDGFARIEPAVISSSTRGGDTTTGVDFLVYEREMPDSGWRVLILSNANGVRRQVAISALVSASILVIFMLVAANIYQRRRRMIERMAIQDTARHELETRVLERTQILTETNVKLCDEIDERHRAERELKTAQVELVQASKLAALGQMAAGLSHELNQPLAAIRSYADNAATFLDRTDLAPARSNLLGIAELTERMAKIIKNLRTYARNEQVPARPAVLQDAIAEALALLQGRLDTDAVAVHLDVPEDLPPVMGGDVRLQQVFINLFTNAIDAMEKSTQRDLRVRATADAGGVQICVQDSGPGVRADVLENVFDPFYSTKDVGEGMGLGLSITFGIVRQFGGTITVSNADTGGAVFTLTLPLAAIADEAAE